VRLWSLHPRYLDPQGLVAVWREALLAKAVLHGRTRGYRHHPQLVRFRAHAAPRAAICTYLAAIHAEACAREYTFDVRKIGRARAAVRIAVTHGQLAYEWAHLLRKLARRNPALYRRWRTVRRPDPHPMFRLGRGGVEAWERTEGGAAAPPTPRKRARAPAGHAHNPQGRARTDRPRARPADPARRPGTTHGTRSSVTAVDPYTRRNVAKRLKLSREE